MDWILLRCSNQSTSGVVPVVRAGGSRHTGQAASPSIIFKQYQKKVESIINLDLVILDDFLLHPITEDDEVKALYDILEKRNELSRSCIICSQRDPKAWSSMLLEDVVSSNSLLKRVIKHYNVMIEHKVVD